MKPFLLAIVLSTVGASSTSIAAETYKVDKSHADLLFSIEHAGFSKKHGSFRDFDGTLQCTAAAPESCKVDITVKTNSVDTALAARDRDLNGPGFFDSTKYPEMRFVSTRVVPGENQLLRIEGDLTLHGVTKSIVLNAKLNKAGPNPFDKTPMLGFSGEGILKRSDFGMSNLIPVIGDLVKIEVDIEFKQVQ
jgi:polyisoprenoid-binding protein YceI